MTRTLFTVTNSYLTQTYCAKWLLERDTDAQWFHHWTAREPRTAEQAKQDVLRVKPDAVYMTPEEFEHAEKSRQEQSA